MPKYISVPYACKCLQRPEEHVRSIGIWNYRRLWPGPPRAADAHNCWVIPLKATSIWWPFIVSKDCDKRSENQRWESKDDRLKFPVGKQCCQQYWSSSVWKTFSLCFWEIRWVWIGAHAQPLLPGQSTNTGTPAHPILPGIITRLPPTSYSVCRYNNQRSTMRSAVFAGRSCQGPTYLSQILKFPVGKRCCQQYWSSSVWKTFSLCFSEEIWPCHCFSLLQFFPHIQQWKST